MAKRKSEPQDQIHLTVCNELKLLMSNETKQTFNIK